MTNNTMGDIKVETCENFDASKLKFGTFMESSGDASGYLGFPKYAYDNGDDILSLVTGEIDICYGGIPKISERWRPTDDDCLYMWIPLDTKNGAKNIGGVELGKCLSKIDKKTQKDLENNKTSEYLSVVGKDKKKNLKSNKNVKYSTCVRDYTPGAGNDNEDDEKDDDVDEEQKEKYHRIKAKIDIESKFDTVTKKIDPKKKTVIKTKVYLLDKKENMILQKVKTLDDLRGLVTYNSTVVLQLDLIKTYFSKNEVNGSKVLSHTWKITQILIKKQGTGGGGANRLVSASVFSGHCSGKNSDDNSDSDSEEEKPKKSSKKQDKDSDSESEEEKPKKSSKKPKDSDSESEEEKPKKSSKKPKDSDSESEEEKPKKSSKKPKDSDSESEEEKPKKSSKKPKDSDSESDEDDKKKKIVKKNKNVSDSESDSDSD